MARPRKSTKQRKEQVSSFFLDLPAELRIEIYHMVLHRETIEIGKRIEVPISKFSTRSEIEKPKGLVPLTRVNGQVRREALPILYANHFWVYSCGGGQCLNFLNRIAPPSPAIQYLTHLTMQGWSYGKSSTFTREVFGLLTHATGLRSLEIWSFNLQQVCLQLERNMHHVINFLLAYGYAHGGDNEAGIRIMTFTTGTRLVPYVVDRAPVWEGGDLIRQQLRERISGLDLNRVTRSRRNAAHLVSP